MLDVRGRDGQKGYPGDIQVTQAQEITAGSTAIRLEVFGDGEGHTIPGAGRAQTAQDDVWAALYSSNAMGTTRIIVPCGCHGRPAIPDAAWGLEQSDAYFLSQRQKDLFASWERSAGPPRCAHRRGEQATMRAGDALALIARLKSVLPREEFPVTHRLRPPTLDFSGDVAVLPPSDCTALAREIETILDHGLLYQLSSANEAPQDPRERYGDRSRAAALLKDLLELARMAARASQPMLIR